MNNTESVFHDRSFNIDGVFDKDDECNFDHYLAMNLCPAGCKEIFELAEVALILQLVRNFAFEPYS